MSQLDHNILQLAEQFVKLAIDETERLEESVLELRKKAAAESLNQERYELALRKVAGVLYNTDFLTDEYEKRAFLKRASEDPIYVVKFLEKVCEAADVSTIGSTSRIKTAPKEAAFDPVFARAFGGYNNSLIDD